MTVTVAELDALPEGEAMRLFRECCGSSRWATKMTALRPFESRDVLLAASDEVWNSLGSNDWREAFAAHPRIGERATGTAANEQSGVASAGDDVRRALARANTDYEQRFGYIYIVCATGKSAEEMLSIANERLANDPESEIRVAAEEQRKIMRLRLMKLLEEST